MTASWWNRLALSELSVEQWERLCDGCGQCCLHVLEDEETGDFARTTVHCRYLDATACRCTDYANRQQNVPACVALTPTRAAQYDWLPPTCAYRLRAAGLPLQDWHPLETGDPDSVHRAGISVRGRIISEEFVPDEHMQDYVMHWVEQGD